MADQNRQLKLHHRFVVIAVLTLNLILCTALGALLLAVPANLPKGVWDWAQILLGSALVVCTTLVTTFTAWVIKVFWRRSNDDEALLRDLLGRLGKALRRPSEVMAIVLMVSTLSLAALSVPSFIDSKTIDLFIMSGTDRSLDDQRQKLLDHWNATHPKIHASYRQAGENPREQHKNMVGQAKNGGQQVDIYNLDVIWTAEFAKKGYIKPLDSELEQKNDFFKGALDTCKYEKKLWALPFNTDVGLLYYRSDLGINPPSSGSMWDKNARTDAEDTLTKAQKIKAKKPSPELRLEAAAAHVTQLAHEEVLTINALEAMWAAGSPIVSAEGILAIEQQGDAKSVGFDADARKGLEDLIEASKNDKVVLPESKASLNEKDGSEAFGNSKALFMRNWPVAYNDLEGTRKNAPFGVAPLPGPSVLGGQNLAISSQSKNPRAAQALIEFLTSPSSQLILFERGGLAATQDIVYDDAYKNEQIYGAERREYAEKLRSALRSARPRPKVVCYADFSKTFREGILPAFSETGQSTNDFFKQLLEDDFPERLAGEAEKVDCMPE